MKYMLIILSLSLGSRLFSQTDPATWDPNDPNCPCHKLANQADEEWKQMQEAQLNTIAYNTNIPQKDIQVAADSDSIAGNTGPVTVIQNNDVPANDSVEVTTNAVSSGTSGGSSYYHYSPLLFEWKSFWKGVRNLRRRMGQRHSGKLKHNFRVANCFEFN